MNRQTIRPLPPKYKDYATAAVAVLVIAVFFSLYEYPQALPAIVGGTLAAVALGAGFGALYFRNSRVALEPGAVSHTNPFGHTKRVAAESVGTVVLVHNFVVITSLRTRRRASDTQLFLLDSSGAALLRLRSDLWGTDALAVVRAALPAAAFATHEQMDPGTMKAAYPRALSFFESNPIVVGVLCALTVVAVLVVVIVVVVTVS